MAAAAAAATEDRLSPMVGDGEEPARQAVEAELQGKKPARRPPLAMWVPGLAAGRPR
jgi:hypothetical protein